MQGGCQGSSAGPAWAGPPPHSLPKWICMKGSGLPADELGLHKLGQSYLSLDTAGRVVRLDSFAKFLAPVSMH